MSVPSEILQAYPDIPEVLTWLTTPLADLSIIESGRKGYDPGEVLDMLKLAVSAAVLRRHPSLQSMTPKQAARYAKILEQLDHPQTLRYVAGKLGAV